MKNKITKAKQRMVNKVIRNINKMIEIDPLWKGRFYIIQVHRQDCRYPDGYSEIIISYDMVDKATGRRSYVRTGVGSNEIWVGNAMAMNLNDFIVCDCDVWAEQPTAETTVDYRKVPKI